MAENILRPNDLKFLLVDGFVKFSSDEIFRRIGDGREKMTSTLYFTGSTVIVNDRAKLEDCRI